MVMRPVLCSCQDWLIQGLWQDLRQDLQGVADRGSRLSADATEAMVMHSNC